MVHAGYQPGVIIPSSINLQPTRVQDMDNAVQMISVHAGLGFQAMTAVLGTVL